LEPYDAVKFQFKMIDFLKWFISEQPVCFCVAALAPAWILARLLCLIETILVLRKATRGS
jgi:hypothetical protein